MRGRNPTSLLHLFAGLVYDNEGYYSGVCKDPNPVSCLWYQTSAFDTKVNGKLVRGNYYKRGKQIGAAILSAWPDVKVKMVYGFDCECMLLHALLVEFDQVCCINA